MIVPLNIRSENIYYKIFKVVFAKLNLNTQNIKGRSRK